MGVEVSTTEERMALFVWSAIGAGVIGAALAAVLRPRWIYHAAITAGVLVGAVIAAQPSLFRADNGFWFAFVMFGVPSVVLALVGGIVVGIVYQEVVHNRRGSGSRGAPLT
ncbi:MAG: hypothetical protein ACJ79K_12385 [Gemmatimonadaceae bacterium]